MFYTPTCATGTMMTQFQSTIHQNFMNNMSHHGSTPNTHGASFMSPMKTSPVTPTDHPATPVWGHPTSGYGGGAANNGTNISPHISPGQQHPQNSTATHFGQGRGQEGGLGGQCVGVMQNPHQEELDMIANLMSKDPLLYGNKGKLGLGDAQDPQQQQRNQQQQQQNMLNQMAMAAGGQPSGLQMGAGQDGNGQSPQVVMNGARLSSTSSGEDTPPSASPNSTASINSILSHQQQQQQHHGLMQGHHQQAGQQQQHHGNIVTNGAGLGQLGLDSPVDITGLLNNQLKTEPFDVSGILGMSQLQNGLHNAGLAGQSNHPALNMAASSSLGSVPGFQPNLWKNFGSLSGLYSQHDQTNTSTGAHRSAFHNSLLSMQSPNTSASGLAGHPQQQVKQEFGSSSGSGGAPGPIRRHRSSAHDSMQKCQFCPKKFPSIAALRNHMEECRLVRVHECAQCGKRFKARGGLQQHNRIHLQERPYHCHFCPKRFTQKSHLDQHERIHTGAKPFVCQFCGRAFRQRSQQMGHEATHTHSNSMAVSQVSQAGSLNLHNQLGNLQGASGHPSQQPHGSGLNLNVNGQSDRGSLSDQSCQNSPVADQPNQFLQHAAQAAVMAASSSQMQQQQSFMDKNGLNAAMLNAMLSNPGGGASQTAVDSLLALKQGQDHHTLQQTLELISGR